MTLYEMCSIFFRFYGCFFLYEHYHPSNTRNLIRCVKFFTVNVWEGSTIRRRFRILLKVLLKKCNVLIQLSWLQAKSVHTSCLITCFHKCVSMRKLWCGCVYVYLYSVCLYVCIFIADKALGWWNVHRF